jgi:hypothetical protein
VNEAENKRTFRDELEAHLNSPLPLLMRMRNFIFGKTHPDYYTQFSFFFALIFWFIFFLWSIIGTIVIRSRDWIEQEKDIQVTQLIENRRLELGFEPHSFIGRLEAFHAISLILWVIAFVGLILMWRKSLKFTYFFFGSCILYIVFMWTMLGFGYWAKDTTSFDKITLLLMIGQSAVYAYILKREQEGNSVRFFGVDDDQK